MAVIELGLFFAIRFQWSQDPHHQAVENQRCRLRLLSSLLLLVSCSCWNHWPKAVS